MLHAIITTQYTITKMKPHADDPFRPILRGMGGHIRNHLNCQPHGRLISYLHFGISLRGRGPKSRTQGEKECRMRSGFQFRTLWWRLASSNRSTIAGYLIEVCRCNLYPTVASHGCALALGSMTMLSITVPPALREDYAVSLCCGRGEYISVFQSNSWIVGSCSCWEGRSWGSQAAKQSIRRYLKYTSSIENRMPEVKSPDKTLQRVSRVAPHHRNQNYWRLAQDVWRPIAVHTRGCLEIRLRFIERRLLSCWSSPL